MEQIVVRPVPDKSALAAMKEGKAKAFSVSSSWYEKGALVAADGVMWLLDAEGQRRDVLCPPNGRLVRTYLWSPRGNESWYYTLSVTDEQHNRFTDLPVEGLEKVDGLDALAEAAGLTFVERKINLLTDVLPDRHKGPGFVALDRACLANRDRSAVGRLFHRS